MNFKALEKQRLVQTHKLIERLGGPTKVANKLKRYKSTVYRWTWSKGEGGTGGLIPIERYPEFLRISKGTLTKNETKLFAAIVRPRK